MRGFQARLQRAVALVLRRLGREQLELSLRCAHVAAVQQQADQFEACRIEAGVERQRILERLAYMGDLAGLARGQPFAVGHVGRLRDHAVKKPAQLALGQHADKLVDWLAIHKGDHVRNAAHVEVRRQLGVFIRIDLGELPLAGVFGFELFQHRAQRAAGPAPRCPEIDQYRDLARCFDHFLRETLRGDVAHRRDSPGKSAAGRVCRRCVEHSTWGCLRPLPACFCVLKNGCPDNG